MEINKQYFCTKCEKWAENIGIVQNETHYYSFSLRTRQIFDFHGDESVESQNYFCLSCNKNLNSEIIEKLLDN